MTANMGFKMTYLIAMEGCEAADPHAQFQYYADAEPFALKKSRKHKDIIWVLCHVLQGREVKREYFRDGRHVPAPEYVGQRFEVTR